MKFVYFRKKFREVKRNLGKYNILRFLVMVLVGGESQRNILFSFN